MGCGNRRVAAALVLAAFALPVVFSIRKSATFDEPPQLAAGLAYWATGRVEIHRMHPPLIKLLCAAPLALSADTIPLDAADIERWGNDPQGHWKLGRRVLKDPDAARRLVWARIPAAILSAMLAFVIWRWSSALWGAGGGLLSLVLYVFDPTMTAHAAIVKNDVGAAFFATAFLYLLRAETLSRSPASLLASGGTLGLALGAKYTSLVLIPLGAGLLLLASPRRTRDQIAAIARTFGICLLAYGTLWAIYLFPSDPEFYWRGVSSIHSDNDPSYPNLLGGEFRTGPWPAYLPLAFVLKTPLPTLFVLVWAGAAFARGTRRELIEEAWTIVPLVVFALGHMFLTPPLGLRYAIPCYPFLFILAGRLGKYVERQPRPTRMGVLALVAWLVVEYAMIAPDHLSYFNEAAGGPRGGIEWLDDSNVDWGQGLIQLSDYARAEKLHDYRLCAFTSIDPKIYGVRGTLIPLVALRSRPPPGTLVLSAHCWARARADLRARHGDGAENWLGGLEPIASVGHAFYVFELREAR